jgi:hypothetical protein
MRTTKQLLMLLAITTSQIVSAKTITVHSTADDGAGSLRQAIASASNGDKINIVVNGTITLTSGELLVDKSLTIKGPGTHGIISGNNASRVFHITPGTTVTLDSLTITNGASNPDYTTYPDSAGGGIYNDHAKLTVSNCTLSNNVAVYGAGLFNDSTVGSGPSVTVNNSTFNNNSAFYGAALYNNGELGAATLAVSNCSLLNNSAPNDQFGFPSGYGAGAFNDGFSGSATLIVTNTQESGGRAIYGAGIFNSGEAGGSATFSLINSALADNYGTGGKGVGIYNDGESGTATATLLNSKIIDGGAGVDNDGQNGGNATLTLNNSTLNSGGGIENDGQFGNATLLVTNSTISGSLANVGGIFNDGQLGSATCSLTNSNVTGGNGPGIWNYAEGGGSAVLNLTKSSVRKNKADFGGAGIRNSGTDGSASTTLTDSTVSDNSSLTDGGGIGNQSGVLTVNRSVVSNNSCTDPSGNSAGGGIYNSSDSGNATLIVTDSTISGNSAGFSSGIYNEGISGTASVTLNNSTASGNFITEAQPSFGAGCIYSVAVDGEVAVTLNNSTVSDNTHVGVFNDAINNSATLRLNDSTIADNPGTGVLTNAHPGASAVVVVGNTILSAKPSDKTIANLNNTSVVDSKGYNISSDASGGDNSTGPGGLLNGPGDTRNTNPMLGPLQNNGGPTMTQALLKNSPAINAGDPNFNPYLFSPPLLYDQRGPGFPRVVGGRLDIGAFESQH